MQGGGKGTVSFLSFISMSIYWAPIYAGKKGQSSDQNRQKCLPWGSYHSSKERQTTCYKSKWDNVLGGNVDCVEKPERSMESARVGEECVAAI